MHFLNFSPKSSVLIELISISFESLHSRNKEEESYTTHSNTQFRRKDLKMVPKYVVR
jgi:hypothetical protein